MARHDRVAGVRGVLDDSGILAGHSHPDRLLALAAGTAVSVHCAGLDGAMGDDGCDHAAVAGTCALSRMVDGGACGWALRGWDLALSKIRSALQQAAVVWLVGVEGE